MYKIHLFKNTYFGSDNMVWNIPSLDYDFSLHEKKIFNNVVVPRVLSLSEVILYDKYSLDYEEYDYFYITEVKNEKEVILAYYFVNSIIGDEKNSRILLSVQQDIMTTNKAINLPITGTIIRKHDTKINETPFDYPTATNVEAVQWESTKFDTVSYLGGVKRVIESAVDLSEYPIAVPLSAGGGASISVPKLKQPTHKTDFVLQGISNLHYDRTGAFTLYDADLVDQDILDSVRGMSGDGAISDSYTLPLEAFIFTQDGAKITKVQSTYIEKQSKLNVQDIFNEFLTFTPKNQAIYGMFKIVIQSTILKNSSSWQGFDIRDSIDEDGYIKFRMWADGKPSGNPFCAPTQVDTLHPASTLAPADLAVLDSKSVKGMQWVRNPLIYKTAQGEKYAEIENVMQRRQINIDYKNAMTSLDIGKKERDLQYQQAKIEYDTSLIGAATNTLNHMSSSEKFGSLISPLAKGAETLSGKTYSDSINLLKEFEYTKQKEQLNLALGANLTNLEVGKAITRNVPLTKIYTESESLNSYDNFNAFNVLFNLPDVNTLRAKDQEYSVYGYPVYENVSGFVISQHLRENHTVYQFDSPLLDKGGTLGENIKAILSSGVRILSKRYTVNNLINNPKR